MVDRGSKCANNVVNAGRHIQTLFNTSFSIIWCNSIAQLRGAMARKNSNMLILLLDLPMPSMYDMKPETFLESNCCVNGNCCRASLNSSIDINPSLSVSHC